VRRREFITLLGGTAVAWPLAARAQQSAVPVIGFLSSRSPEESAHLLEAFRRGLREGGFAENENVRIEFRWANGDYGRLPASAAESLRLRIASSARAVYLPLPFAAFLCLPRCEAGASH
jgi:putative ABC transport system substrate-binding protein